jgi:CMP-N-acetylneuraminic acid synthetase
MKHEILAVIPVSGQDTEFRRGWPELGGRSLLEYTFDAVRGSRLIRRAIVATDSRQIAAAARTAGLEVPFVRPRRQRRLPMAQLLKDLVVHTERIDPTYRPDWIVRLQVTFPFRAKGFLDSAIRTVLSQDLDSAFAAWPEFDTFWYLGDSGPQRITTDTRVPRSKRVPIYRELGGLFSMVHRTVLDSGSLYGERLGIIPLETMLSSVDIHAVHGFEMATLVADAVKRRRR